MKSKIFNILSLLAVMSFGFFSCIEPEPPVEEEQPTETNDPVLEVTVKSVDQTSVELEIKSANLKEIAYVLSEEQVKMTMPAVIFASEARVDTTATSVTITELEANKTYWAYFAARLEGDYYDKIVEVTFTTNDYAFDKMLTLVDTDYMGYSMRITVPASVKAEPEKYAIRYNFGALVDCMAAKYEMGRTWAATLLENGHGCVGWQEAHSDTTVVITPYNQNRQNPDGSYYVDPETGEEIMLHSPIAPNEPYLFIAGEYRYGDIAETGWGWSYGDPKKDVGFYIPLWDQAAFNAEVGDLPKRADIVCDLATNTFLSGEEKYWTGAFQTLFFKTKAPEKLETEFEILIEDVTAIDAKISLIPDENVYCYSYMICDDATYNDIIDGLLLGNEDWLEWFVCSFYAMRYLYVPTISGPIQLQAREYTTVPLSEETTYHVLVTATGEPDGSKQSFFHQTFDTTRKTKDAPIINVTAVEDNENEYFATFNVKAPNKDVIRAYYAADYKREFILEANTGTQYEYLAQNPFSENDITLINSDKGLDVQIPATDGQIVRMIVLGYNDEETKNALYSPEKYGNTCPAVADCRTKLLAMVPQNNNPLFKTLEGTWTAKAKMVVKQYDSNNNLQEFQQVFTTKIDIMDKYDLPALTDDVYDIYASLDRPRTKDEVDAYYADLQREVDLFNDYRLIYRNRMLCIGWFDYDFVSPSRLATKTPYDLFTWLDYSSIDNAQALYDFGPKWYLEIDANGNVTVPFDQWQTPPMTNWQSSVFFMAAYNYETNHGYKQATANSAGDIIMPASFPVEVVNNDKLIIRPVQAALTDEENAQTYPHYPNAIGGWGVADATIIRPVVSEITLERGWSEPKSTAAPNNYRRNYVERVDMTGEDAKPVVLKSITSIKNIDVPEFKQAPMHIVTIDMVKEAAKKRTEELIRK